MIKLILMINKINGVALFNLNRQRMGHDLDGLNFDELQSLEENISSALAVIRERKV